MYGAVVRMLCGERKSRKTSKHVKANSGHDFRTGESVGNIPYGQHVWPLFKGLIIQIKPLSNSKISDYKQVAAVWPHQNKVWLIISLLSPNHWQWIISPSNYLLFFIDCAIVATASREVNKSPRAMCQLPLPLKNSWGHSPVDIHSFVLCHLRDRRIPLCQQRGTNKAYWSFLCLVYWPK